MINVLFNKTLTKKLVKSTDPYFDMSKNHLDWLLEEQNKLCGCIYQSPIKKQTVFFIEKNKENYSLICYYKNSLHIYSIEDIEQFLDFIKVDELKVEENDEEISSDSVQSIKEIGKLSYNGIVEIDNNKIYLYDIIRK